MTTLASPSLQSDREALLSELTQLGVHVDDLDTDPVLARVWLLGMRDHEHLTRRQELS